MTLKVVSSQRLLAAEAQLHSCAALRLYCRPAERRTAEQDVRLVYALANLTHTRRIVWCGGPMEIAEQLAAARDPESIGTGVKDALDEYLRVSSPSRGFWKIAASAGWLVPNEQICWISERPDVIRADAHGRLHNAEGPVLRYRDGWSV